MLAFVEPTNFNVRCGPACDGPTADYEVAVNCVVADGQHAVVKALSPEVKFTAAHFRAIVAAVRSLGFVPVWTRSKREGKFMSVAKQKIPHPSTVTGDAAHIAAAEAAFEQIKAGHYKASNVRVSQTDVSPGVADLHISFRRTETDPTA